MNNDSTQPNQPPPPPVVGGDSSDEQQTTPTPTPPVPGSTTASTANFGATTPQQNTVGENPVINTPNQSGNVKSINTGDSGGRKLSKKTVAAILGVLVLIIGAVSGLLLVQRQQDIRERAGSVGGVECTTPNGLELLSRSSPGSAGDLGYRPIPERYNVGDVVNFNVQVSNTTGSSVSDQYNFTVNKVIEAPIGQEPAPNLTEEEMYTIHGDLNQGTLQTEHYSSGNQSYSVPANSQTTVSGSWTSDDCGYFQLDMELNEFSSCTSTGPSGFGVVAAGFIQVIGCQIFATDPPGGTPPPPDFPTPPATSTPGGGTPPPPPSQEATCADIRIYDLNDNQLSVSELSNLSEGDSIKIEVNGATTAESRFDRGRFRVRTDSAQSVAELSWVESTDTDGGNSFYYIYTLPSGASTFTIEAEIHHSTLGWL